MTDMLPPLTHILVIDDDPNLLLLLTKMLARIGAKTTTAETGVEGLDLLDKVNYDLLILDLMLPDVDGYEILRRLREETRYDKLPILILSARADPDAISRGLGLGADGYLTKPYLPNTLTSRVRTLLAQGRKTT
ncbi:MAG: response regulator [Anaerolineae bacterium]|nr:response regulator [Anaerolineae bacterium]